MPVMTSASLTSTELICGWDGIIPPASLQNPSDGEWPLVNALKSRRINQMKQLRDLLILAALISAASANAIHAQQSAPPCARVVDLKSADGILLKATYFAVGRPGPGVILFHQNNRTRTSWGDVARQLAAAGINTLTLDSRGHGESGGTREYASQKWQADEETAFRFLISQPGVQHDVIGVAGSGSDGVINAVETARLQSNEVKSLLLMSGETFRPGIEFLHESSQLPELFVVADTDEYPPTVEAMLWMYARASSPSRKLIHYSAAQDAPWLWYETSDPNKVPATGSHGTDLFKIHSDLSGIIVQWFVTTLVKTPGHAPADPLASSTILNLLTTPGGAAQVKQQLIEARRKDPHAQLWPEVSGDIIGSGQLREGQTKAAIDIFQVNLLAYPDSADAHSNLADAYLQDGEKDLAREYAQKALALLDSHTAPASSWSDTEQRRAEIRQSIQDTLKKLSEESR
jgi:tetratricopeptide (TPR) repeat protein